MKKKITADLISIAHRILQLKDHTTLLELQEEAKQLYDTLTILHFTETHFAGSQPTIGQVHAILEELPHKEALQPVPKEKETPITKEEKLPLKEVSQPIAIAVEKAPTITPEERHQITKAAPEILLPEDIQNVLEQEQPNTPKPAEKPAAIIPEPETVAPVTQTEVTPSLAEEPSTMNKNKPEFVIDEVNAAISEDLFIPASTKEPHTNITNETIAKSPIAAPTYQKNDKEDVVAVTKTASDRPKSLNDTLKKNITIGLNDRLAFIKHLFDGSSADYNRVLSQLNTMNNSHEAGDFIQSRVKPDYHNWENKEEYEARFMEIIHAKFD